MSIFNYTAIKDSVNYSAFLPGQKGSHYDPNTVIVPAVAEDTIEFGSVVDVHLDADDQGIGCRYAKPIVSNATIDKLTGIALADVKGQNVLITRQAHQFINAYAKGQAVSVMKKGFVWVPVQSSGTINEGGAVYVRVKASSTNASLPIGGIETAADSTNTIAWTGVKFTGESGFPLSGTNDGTTVAGGLTGKTAEIYLDLDLI